MTKGVERDKRNPPLQKEILLICVSSVANPSSLPDYAFPLHLMHFTLYFDPDIAKTMIDTNSG